MQYNRLCHVLHVLSEDVELQPKQVRVHRLQFVHTHHHEMLVRGAASLILVGLVPALGVASPTNDNLLSVCKKFASDISEFRAKFTYLEARREPDPVPSLKNSTGIEYVNKVKKLTGRISIREPKIRLDIDPPDETGVSAIFDDGSENVTLTTDQVREGSTNGFVTPSKRHGLLPIRRALGQHLSSEFADVPFNRLDLLIEGQQKITAVQQKANRALYSWKIDALQCTAIVQDELLVEFGYEYVEPSLKYEWRLQLSSYKTLGSKLLPTVIRDSIRLVSSGMTVEDSTFTWELDYVAGDATDDDVDLDLPKGAVLQTYDGKSGGRAVSAGKKLNTVDADFGTTEYYERRRNTWLISGFSGFALISILVYVLRKRNAKGT